MSENPFDRMEMAFEEGVEQSPNLWRVTYYRDINGRRLRHTRYFGNQHDCQEFIGRNQDEVVMVREYHLVCEGEA